MKLILRIAVAVALIECVSGQLVEGFAQGTAFTYQGRLNVGGTAANGSYDLAFSLFNTNTTGSAIAGPVTNAAVSVTNGLFTTLVNFGPGVFTGASNWLQIAVSTNAANSFSTLTPRQQLTPTPYAVFAITSGNLSGTLPAAQLSGTLAPSNIAAGTITSTMLAPDAVTMLGTPGNGPTNTVNVSSNGLVGIGIGIKTPAAGLQINNGATEDALSVLYEVQNGSAGFTNLSGPYVAVVTNNLLAVCGDYGITLASITNIAAPTPLSQLVNGVGPFTNISGVTDLAWAGSNLVAAGFGSSAVTIISCTNPASPVKLAELDNGVGGWNYLNGAHSVAVSSSLMAVAAANASAVTLADISNPSAPVIKSTLVNGMFGYTNLGGAASVSISGNLMAVGAAYSNAVTLVNVSNPSSPVKLAEIRNGVGGISNLNEVISVALNGNLLAIASAASSEVLLLDVTTPSNPVLLSQIVDGVGGYSITFPFSVTFSGSLLAIGTANTVLTLVNVSNPSNPTQLGSAAYGLNGADFMNQPSSAAFVGTNLIVPGYSGNSLTVLTMSPQLVGLDSANWVGIGTPVPKAPLDVMGNVLVENASQFNVSAVHVTLGTSAVASSSNAVSIGSSTTASGLYSLALGNGTTSSGNTSTAMGLDTIASGDDSTAMGFSTTASGYDATAMGQYTFAITNSCVAMGYGSTASGLYATAMGYRTVAGGNSSLANGVNNVVTGYSSVIAGGGFDGNNFYPNFNYGDAAFIGSGMGNQIFANAEDSVIAGGGFNSIAGGTFYSVICGGNGNTNGGIAAFVGGGSGNNAGGTNATVPGGYENAAMGTYSFAAGQLAQALHQGAFVWADSQFAPFASTANDQFLIRARGGVGIGTASPDAQLDVGGPSGTSIRVTGPAGGGATVAYDLATYNPGTNAPTARILATDDASFSSSLDLMTKTPGAINNPLRSRLHITSSGNVGIGTNTPSTYLQVINATCNGSSWVNSSDRNLKQDFAAVDTAALLAKVVAMPVQSWDYKAQPGDKHIGPMAQDFHAAFGLNGTDDTHIATVDESGVALAAIQGLNQKLEAENAELKSQNDALSDRLNHLETMLKQLAARK